MTINQGNDASLTENETEIQFNSMQAEMAILGALLFDNRSMEALEGKIRSSDFYSPVNASLYEEIAQRIKAGVVADGVTLHEWAKTNLAGVGGVRYLVTLLDAAAFGPEIRDYAQLVHDHAGRRSITELAHALMSDARKGEGPDTLIENAERSLREIGESAATTWVWEKSSGSGDIFKPFDMSRRIPTGWDHVDRTLRGWPRGSLSVIAGRPGMGKSMVAVSAAVNVARQGKASAFISMEMSREELWVRACADMAFEGRLYSSQYEDPEYEQVSAGRMTPDNLRRMREAKRDLDTLPFYVDDRGPLKPSEMLLWLRRLDRTLKRKGEDLGAVFVDYLQIARPDIDRRGNRVSEVTDMSAALLAIAKELNVAVIALSQLNRGSENRPDTRPRLSDLRDSGAIEQDASVVVTLYRPSYYAERKFREGENLTDAEAEDLARKHDIELDIQKHRNGRTGKVTLLCVPGSNAIRDHGFTAQSQAAE